LERFVEAKKQTSVGVSVFSFSMVKTLKSFVTLALKCSVDELKNFIYFSSTEESTSREVRVICSPYQDQDRSGIKKSVWGALWGGSETAFV
jgi:hypothetical protein